MGPMNISQRQLKIFVALSHSLSFSRCASQLNVTPPTLSKLLRELEESLGVVLFERTTRSVRLTTEGAYLLPIASRMIDAYDHGLEELKGFMIGRADALSIAAIPPIAALIIPECLKRLGKQYPEARLNICDVASEQALELLRARRVGVAFTEFFPELCSDSALEASELLDEDAFVLLVSKDWPQCLDDAVWSEECFNQLPLITLARGLGSSSRMSSDLSLFVREDFRPKYELRCLVTIKGFVECGMGVAVLPKLTAHLIKTDKLRVVELRDSPRRSICSVVRRGEKQPAIQRQFINHLRQQVKLALKGRPDRQDALSFTQAMKQSN